MRPRKNLLPPLLVIFAMTVNGTATAAAKPPPHIILVISDDQRWDAMGAAGNKAIHTPNMDRLAREGVYFPEATVLSPQCMCSRATLLTGLSTHTNGRYSNQIARADTVTPRGFDQYACLPEVLSKAGYHTANVGKWHLEPDPWYVGFRETGTWFPPGAGRYKNAPIAHGRSRERTSSTGFLQTHFGDSAVKIINNHGASATTQPLFLWFATTAPHSPYGPNPPAASAPYKGKSIPDLLPPTYKGNSTRKGAHWHQYYAAVTAVDTELGRIMKALDENHMTTNTIIAFMGDNGYMMGSRNRLGKFVPYEDSIRIPFAIWGPGVFKGKGRTDAVASSLDLPVTLARLAGAKIPPSWQGRDITPTLTDAKAHGTTWSVSETVDYKNPKFPENAYRAVRTTHSKLIVYAPVLKKAPEFYDLTQDPHEEKNLYKDPAMQRRVKELTAVLDNWMTKTDDDWTMRGELHVQKTAYEKNPLKPYEPQSKKRGTKNRKKSPND